MTKKELDKVIKKECIRFLKQSMKYMKPDVYQNSVYLIDKDNVIITPEQLYKNYKK